MPRNRRRRHTSRERELRRDRVVRLALGGVPYRRIAQTVGCSLATVSRDVKARFEEGAEERRESIEHYRKQQHERLELLMTKWWLKSWENLKAFDRVLRLMGREAKLLGLDEPMDAKIEAQVKRDASKVVMGIVRELVAEFKGGGDEDARTLVRIRDVFDRQGVPTSRK